MSSTLWKARPPAALRLKFQAIHDQLRPRIRAYLTRLVGQFDAENLTQEVFLRASQSLKRFRGESQVATWVYRIATNAAIDKLASRLTAASAAGAATGAGTAAATAAAGCGCGE